MAIDTQRKTFQSVPLNIMLRSSDTFQLYMRGFHQTIFSVLGMCRLYDVIDVQVLRFAKHCNSKQGKCETKGTKTK